MNEWSIFFSLQKSSEIKSLLDQLGEDSSTYDVEFKPHIHRKVMELRSSDMSSGMYRLVAE